MLTGWGVVAGTPRVLAKGPLLFRHRRGPIISSRKSTRNPKGSPSSSHLYLISLRLRVRERERQRETEREFPLISIFSLHHTFLCSVPPSSRLYLAPVALLAARPPPQPPLPPPPVHHPTPSSSCSFRIEPYDVGGVVRRSVEVRSTEYVS